MEYVYQVDRGDSAVLRTTDLRAAIETRDSLRKDGWRHASVQKVYKYKDNWYGKGEYI